MKKCIASALLSILLVCTMTGCSVVSGGGTPPVLTVDDVEITIGESNPYDLTSQGFETTFPGNVMAIGELPGNSWLSEFMSANKDSKKYAYLYIYNPNKESKTYGLSTIYKVSFTMFTEENNNWADNNILVNGIDFFGMDSESVKEEMKDYKLANETDSGSLRFEDGDYNYIFIFQEGSGAVEEIVVEKTIAKSYDEA